MEFPPSEMFSAEPGTDLSTFLGAVLLFLALCALAWLLPCSPKRVKGDEPYYGSEEAEITALNVYPLKSCAGLEAQEWPVGPRGLLADRAWMVARKVEGRDKLRFVTQRQVPRMVLVHPSFPEGPTGKVLRLSAEGMADLDVPVIGEGGGRELLHVRVWNDHCAGYDQGEEASKWLETFLNQDGLVLLHMPEHFQRSLNPKYIGVVPSATTGFADGYPILLAAEESLEDLNVRMVARGKTPVSMERFRPNIVIDGMGPWAEDYWTKIRINGCTIYVVKPCDRCKIPTVDTSTGEYSEDHEPTLTLQTFRTEGHLRFGIGGGSKDVYFGQNVVADCSSTHNTVLRVGDRIEILRVKRKPPSVTVSSPTLRLSQSPSPKSKKKQ